MSKEGPPVSHKRRRARWVAGAGLGLVASGVAPGLISSAQAQETSAQARPAESGIVARVDSATLKQGITPSTEVGASRFTGTVVITKAEVATPVADAPKTDPGSGLDATKVEKGNVLSRLAEKADTAAVGKKNVDNPLIWDTTVLAGAASGIKNLDLIKPGETVQMLNPDTIKTIDAAHDKKGDPTIVKAVAALEKAMAKKGYNHVGKEAKAVLDQLDIAIPKVEAHKPKDDAHTNTVDATFLKKAGVTKDELAPDKTVDAKVLTAEVGAAIDNGTLQETKLKGADTMWGVQANEGQKATGHKVDNPTLNVTSRIAVEATKYNPDTKISKDGKFDEHKMHTGDTFTEPSNEVKSLMGGIASMNPDQVLALKDKVPHEAYVDLLKIWLLNHRTSNMSKEQIAQSDLAAAQVAFKVLANPDTVKVLTEAKVFQKELAAAKTAQERGDVIVKEAETIKTILTGVVVPDGQDGAGDGANPGTGPGGQDGTGTGDGANPGNPGQPGTGTETAPPSASPSNSPESSPSASPTVTESPSPTASTATESAAPTTSPTTAPTTQEPSATASPTATATTPAPAVVTGGNEKDSGGWFSSIWNKGLVALGLGAAGGIGWRLNDGDVTNEDVMHLETMTHHH